MRESWKSRLFAVGGQRRIGDRSAAACEPAIELVRGVRDRVPDCGVMTRRGPILARAPSTPPGFFARLADGISPPGKHRNSEEYHRSRSSHAPGCGRPLSRVRQAVSQNVASNTRRGMSAVGSSRVASGAPLTNAEREPLVCHCPLFSELTALYSGWLHQLATHRLSPSRTTAIVPKNGFGTLARSAGPSFSWSSVN